MFDPDGLPGTGVSGTGVSGTGVSGTGVSGTGLPEGHVVVGRIGKPFGVDGDVYVFVDPDLTDSLEVGAECRAAGRPEPLRIRRCRRHADRLVVGFVGVDRRQDALGLRGTVLSRPRGEIALAAGAVWVDELVGRAVVDREGQVLGSVKAIRDGHAHDYLVLTRPVRTKPSLTGPDEAGPADAETVIPMVPELVDWRGDPVVVHRIPGLLDLDEAL